MITRNEPMPAQELERQPQAPTAAGGRAPEERRVVAWVGKSVVFKGELSSSEDMTIDGRVEGTIDVSNHTLTIGPDADIRADILAKVVTILGAVHGAVTASEKVVVPSTGSIEGDVSSPRLGIADGAVLRGRIDTNRAAARPSQG